MQQTQISRKEFDDLLKATDELHDSIRDYLAAWILKGRPVPASQLDRECQEFGNEEAIVTAYDHGSIINDLVANQLIALTRTLTPPYLAQASWTVLRMLLESAALSAWLLDPNCTAAERVNRSFSYRWVGLVEQKKFADALKTTDLADAEQKLVELEAEARALSVEVRRSKTRKIDWVGMPPPSSTALVKIVLDEESWYRLLSSFVHGHQWAALKLSYRQIDDGTGPNVTLAQGVDPLHMAGQLVKAAIWFSRPIWYRSRLNGFELTRLRALLESYADRPLGIVKSHRFWLAGE